MTSLSIPTPPQIDASSLDYLLLEMVNSLRQSSSIATAKTRRREEEMIKAHLLQPPAQNKEPSVADRDIDALKTRLESIGVHVGSNLVERLSRDRARLVDTLDAIKFICKDVWVTVWDKQVDNLRTNHRGVYVLQDNAFRPLTRLSSPRGHADTLATANLYVLFHAGVLKGALARLGLQATVTPEITELPRCVFQIKMPKS